MFSTQNHDIYLHLHHHTGSDLNKLTPKELNSINKSSSDKRKRDFSAGRIAAKAALSKSGFKEEFSLINSNRIPEWPTGFVGSISHSNNMAISVVAKSNNYNSLGVDIESRKKNLSKDLIKKITTDKEQRWLNSKKDFSTYGLILFSAKESIYKSLSSIGFTNIGFKDVNLAILEREFRIEAEFVIQGIPLEQIRLFYTIEDEYVSTLCLNKK